MVYVDEMAQPRSGIEHSLLGTGCTVQRWPEGKWGQYMQMLPPVLLEGYTHVAVVLDDVFIPPQPFSVPDLLWMMGTYDLGVLSPVIIGGHHKSSWTGIENRTQLRGKRRRKCLFLVQGVEIYATIFTVAAWSCMYSMLDYANPGGCGIDYCMYKRCPAVRIGVDRRMVAYHLHEKMPPDWHLGGLAREDVKVFRRKQDAGRNKTLVESLQLPNPCNWDYGLEKWGCNPSVLQDRGKAIACSTLNPGYAGPVQDAV